MWSIFLGGLFLIGAYAWIIEPAQTAITKHTISVKDLKKPLRILLLTDFHLGIFTSPQRILEKITLVEKENIDLILLGGDFIDANPTYLSQIEPIIQRLQTFERPIFAVPGNHDYDTFPDGIEIFETEMARLGVPLLRNQAHIAMVANQEVVVAGVDDLEQSPIYGIHKPWVPLSGYAKRCQKMDWYSGLDHIGPGLPRILLSHNPDGIHLPGVQPDVVLAGHTHGGRIFLVDWLARPLWRLIWKLLTVNS